MSTFLLDYPVLSVRFIPRTPNNPSRANTTLLPLSTFLKLVPFMYSDYKHCYRTLFSKSASDKTSCGFISLLYQQIS